MLKGVISCGKIFILLGGFGKFDNILYIITSKYIIIYIKK